MGGDIRRQDAKSKKHTGKYHWVLQNLLQDGFSSNMYRNKYVKYEVNVALWSRGWFLKSD